MVEKLDVKTYMSQQQRNRPEDPFPIAQEPLQPVEGMHREPPWVCVCCFSLQVVPDQAARRALIRVSAAVYSTLSTVTATVHVVVLVAEGHHPLSAATLHLLYIFVSTADPARPQCSHSRSQLISLDMRISGKVTLTTKVTSVGFKLTQEEPLLNCSFLVSY